MDASNGPGPEQPAEGQPPSDDDETGSQHEGSLLGGLFRRATGALNGNGTGSEDPDSDGLDALFERLSPAERAMMMNITRLGDLRVEDVMTPRADIVAVPEDASLGDIAQAARRGSLSRLPVYRETLDDPIGFVHLKDLALRYGVGCSADTERPFQLREHLRDALFVPPSMRIAPLMQRMQAERVHMALVIDEFGGVDGLVTIEDLLEQVVGDIEDEHDAEELALWREEASGVYLVNARTDVKEFEEHEGVSLLPEDWEEDVDTFGGLVFMLTGRVPARGEVIAHPMGHEFEITEADPRRIRRIRLTLHGALAASAASHEAAE